MGDVWNFVVINIVDSVGFLDSVFISVLVGVLVDVFVFVSVFFFLMFDFLADVFFDIFFVGIVATFVGCIAF